MKIIFLITMLLVFVSEGNQISSLSKSIFDNLEELFSPLVRQQTEVYGGTIFTQWENVRFWNSYKEIKQIANSDECLRLCSSETQCTSVSFLWSSRYPNFSWYQRSFGNICYFYRTSDRSVTDIGQEFFTSYTKEYYNKLENTRYLNSYSHVSHVESNIECLRLCSTDRKCKSVTFLWSSRYPNFSWYQRSFGNMCWFFNTSKPTSFAGGKQFFTSYVRL